VINQEESSMKMNCGKSKATIVFLSILATILIYLYIKYFSNQGQSKKIINNNETNHNGVTEGENEIPLSILFSAENIAEYLRKNQYHHKPEAIMPEPPRERSNRRTIVRPEEAGEDYSQKSVPAILAKLKGGDKIEQRKAANAIWEKCGTKAEGLTEEEKAVIAACAKKYLTQIKSDFEENTMQIQRLWHLAAPALLEEAANEDVSVSENAARFLSAMKTPQIIDRLIAKSSKSLSPREMGKYIFALQYMKINNRCFLENRYRMSDVECENYYNSKVVPQIEKLTHELGKSK